MSFSEKDGREMDAAVERVLAGLRGTRVPEGLERRVLGAVLEREAAGVGGGVQGWVWAAAAAVLVAGCVMGTAVWRGRRAEVVGVAPAPRMGVAARTQPVAAEIEAPRVGLAKVDAPARVRRVVAASAPAADFVEPMIAEGRVPAATREVDAEARAEARAPSMPAPPEPLTAEERRLRRVATQGTAEQKAALNPVVRERQYEAAKQAVMEFFEPPNSSKPADQVQE